MNSKRPEKDWKGKHGAAKDLQIRMKKIEEQLRVMQRLTSVDVDLDALPTREEIENATGEKLEENDVNG